MIGIDTNVLVRYITRDDPRQSHSASALMESLSNEQKGFISLVAIAELGWVLNRSYKFIRVDFIQALKALLGSQVLLIESEQRVKEALLLFAQSNADFGDCLIAACSHSYSCTSTVTCDKQAATSLGMELLP